MDLKGHKTLEELFLSFDENKEHVFPHNDKYVTRYKYLSESLNKWIHPFVVPGNIATDGGYLNDHGPDHIKKVILRASLLLKDSKIILTEYETYILLMAIHIHDLGNMLGRDHHEVNSMGIINKYGINAGQDRIEWDCIFEIAEAHGGLPKDKISSLFTETVLDFPVRKQLLAAILKFADELAEDRTRASRFLLTADSIPETAEIYHRYSYCLHSVGIDSSARQITLSFDVEEDDLCKIFKKAVEENGVTTTKDVYLIDEIYSRTYKTHLERMYCMRFTRPDLQFDKIRIDIMITTKELDERKRHIKKHIVYDIGEIGYPNSHNDGLYSICPVLINYTGEKICNMSKEKKLEDVTATY